VPEPEELLDAAATAANRKDMRHAAIMAIVSLAVVVLASLLLVLTDIAG
jgi:hypothetical protein